MNVHIHLVDTNLMKFCKNGKSAQFLNEDLFYIYVMYVCMKESLFYVLL